MSYLDPLGTLERLRRESLHQGRVYCPPDLIRHLLIENGCL